MATIQNPTASSPKWKAYTDPRFQDRVVPFIIQIVKEYFSEKPDCQLHVSTFWEKIANKEITVEAWEKVDEHCKSVFLFIVQEFDQFFFSPSRSIDPENIAFEEKKFVGLLDQKIEENKQVWGDTLEQKCCSVVLEMVGTVLIRDIFRRHVQSMIATHEREKSLDEQLFASIQSLKEVEQGHAKYLISRWSGLLLEDLIQRGGGYDLYYKTLNEKIGKQKIAIEKWEKNLLEFTPLHQRVAYLYSSSIYSQGACASYPSYRSIEEMKVLLKNVGYAFPLENFQELFSPLIAETTASLPPMDAPQDIIGQQDSCLITPSGLKPERVKPVPSPMEVEVSLPTLKESKTERTPPKAVEVEKTPLTTPATFIRPSLAFEAAIVQRLQEEYKEHFQLEGYQGIITFGKNLESHKDKSQLGPVAHLRAPGTPTYKDTHVYTGLAEQIDANWLVPKETKYRLMITEAPRPQKFNAYWHTVQYMADRLKSKEIHILMANHMDETNWDCYWKGFDRPTEERPFSLSLGLETIESECVRRVFKFQMNGKPEITINHYHFYKWRDGTAHVDVEMVGDLVYKLVDKKIPCIVHCAAGQNRSIVLAATYIAVVKIFNKYVGNFSKLKAQFVKDIIDELRAPKTGRSPGALHSRHQYVLIHTLVAYICKKHFKTQWSNYNPIANTYALTDNNG